MPLATHIAIPTEEPKVEIRRMPGLGSEPGCIVSLANHITFTVTIICVCVLSIGIAAYFLVLGLANLDKCPAEPKIPIYLVVSGATTLIAAVLSCCCTIGTNCCENVATLCGITIDSLFGLFSIVWVIFGAIWTYFAYEPSYEPGSPKYCDWWTYNVTLGSLIVLAVLVFCRFCCCGCTVRATVYNRKAMPATHIAIPREPARLEIRHTLSPGSDPSWITTLARNTCFLVTIVCVCFLSIGIAVFFIILGMNNLDKCPAEPKIPLYLAVCGIATLVASLLSCCCTVGYKCSNVATICGITIDSIFGMFSTVWVIFGAIWTYGVYEPTYEPGSSKYCDWWTYNVTLGSLLVIGVLVVGKFCCCGCTIRTTVYYRKA